MANDLIDPKEVDIEAADKTVRKFIVSKVPYLAGGREICTQFVPTGLPKIGEYKANEELAIKMFKFIEAVKSDGSTIRLSTPQLVDNHLPDFLTGIRLEAAMLEHNLGFSVAEKISGFLDSLTQAIGQSTSKILTAFQERSSQVEKQQSTNSEPSIQ